MSIHILWHRIWGINKPVSGLCQKDGKMLWFEWNEYKKIYNAYSLTEEELKEVDMFREQLEGVLGKVIYHDNRFSFSLPKEDKYNICPDFPISPKDLFCTFSVKDVQNLIPV